MIILENGRIIEVSNHEELMSMRGKYYEMFMNQVRMGMNAPVIGKAA